jgi:hypothetical protein
VQNERSGARKQRKRDDEVLSPIEAEARHRGRDLKRYIRAAAALNEIYDDVALADAVGVGRGAVAGWWIGAQIKPENLRQLADTTGLAPEELSRFVYWSGPPPRLQRDDLALEPIRAGAQQAQLLLDDADPGTPPSLPQQRPRGTGAERG